MKWFNYIALLDRPMQGKTRRECVSATRERSLINQRFRPRPPDVVNLSKQCLFLHFSLTSQKLKRAAVHSQRKTFLFYAVYYCNALSLIFTALVSIYIRCSMSAITCAYAYSCNRVQSINEKFYCYFTAQLSEDFADLELPLLRLHGKGGERYLNRPEIEYFIYL